ncbi:hypothetical protein TSUD_28090 [Trifolium subterraneum]|uniref:Reverse transcriptase domain-containing protein n=1 Tax=Trifolium subterraneum TaxID=3900 RepID=A0A2Z6NEZ7_TRISU|nr:hypothetical protein TSUD_28090 [Trifolium subterraneum]
MSRLDRFLLSEELCLTWPNCIQEAHLRGLSDHCPLILEVDEENWGPRPSRMLKCWKDIPGYHQLVRDKWNTMQIERWGGFVFKEKFKIIKGVLKECSLVPFGSRRGMRNLNTSTRLYQVEGGELSFLLFRPGVDNLQFKRLTPLEGGSLTKPFSIEEVKTTVCDCDSYKSPGPDGINFGFIKDFWPELKDDNMRFIAEFHRNGKLTKGLNSTFIALIPKTAFVKDIQILDGILIANEAVDEARRTKKELFLFKVDFEKAYDSVDCGYLDAVMGIMSFPVLWRKWMKECICTASASILVNGSLTDKFPLERGLRQGDPLSPFLFLLAAEGLNVLMQAMVEHQFFSGYSSGTQNPISVSHLQFADDTLLLATKSWANVRAMRVVLVLFETMSGLKVNFNKSMLVGVNIADSWLRRRPLCVVKWERVEESVHVLRWSFSSPKVCIDLSETRKTTWISWNTICLNKESGGLGVRRLREFNTALLGKWCWRMLVDRGGLWFRVLAARYVVERWVCESRGRSGSSWWREIVRIRDGVDGLGGGWFGEGVLKKVGDGTETFFWTDPWLGGTPLCVRFGRLFDLAVHKSNTVAEMWSLGWDTRGEAWEWRRQLWAQSSDTWTWRLGPVSGYSVQGAYQLLISHPIEPLDVASDLIWHKQVPLKVSILAWRLLRDRLPTKSNLAIRGIITPEAQSCVTGCGEMETAHHLFISCSIFGSLWSSVRSWIGLSSVDPHDLTDHFLQFTYSSGSLSVRRSFLQLI